MPHLFVASYMYAAALVIFAANLHPLRLQNIVFHACCLPTNELSACRFCNCRWAQHILSHFSTHGDGSIADHGPAATALATNGAPVLAAPPAPAFAAPHVPAIAPPPVPAAPAAPTPTPVSEKPKPSQAAVTFDATRPNCP